jgi:low temperature requirement protein LtrA
MKPKRNWWQPPTLHHAGEGARRVTWLELFYDLVFVVVISKLAHHLGAHPDWGGVRDFVFLFIPVWWVWTSATYYNERFETYDLSFRLFVLLQMLTVAAMAASAEYGLDRATTAFALSYVAARTLIVGLWLRAGYHNPQVRPVTNVYGVGFSLALSLWLISAFVPPALAWPLRLVGTLLDVGTPLLTFSRQSRVFTAAARKLPERFGLFVLIVLGESVIGVINGLGEAKALDLAALLRAVTGLSVGFLLWWIYFDYVGRREVSSGAGKAWSLAGWSYLHLPLVMGLAAIGAMLQHAVVGSTERGVSWILAGAFALVYVCLALLEGVLEPEERPLIAARTIALLRLITAALALLLALIGLPPVGVALGLVALQAVHAVVGVRAWFASEHAGRTDTH